ncbi:MAG: lipid IV(A) 3-deoxy-D-manno-octulosonic acid transferase [Candidatus Berkiella sp.]
MALARIFSRETGTIGHLLRGGRMAWHCFRWLYSLLITLLLPFIFLRLWLRGFSLPAYRLRWAERLGFVPFPPMDNLIWVHAVSVGEVISAIPLIKGLLLQHPTASLLVTTTTPTGSERVQVAFKDILGKRIYHCYLPYDFPFAFNNFFSRLKTKLLIVMETELWPNLLHNCYRRNIPVVIINGRLSPVSVKRYRWLGTMMKEMSRPIQKVAAQSEIDKKRFISLGFDAHKVSNTGNIKFDFELPAYLPQEGEKLRHLLGQERFVWIAASTHEGEESAVLKVYQALKTQFPKVLLFLVPRHPDRFEKVASLCEDAGLHIKRRSKKQMPEPNTDVYLGDTMGELPLFYAASDLAFVGGSLQPIGGHNLLEPAALGLPVLTGPHLFNFVEISQKLVIAGGTVIVQDALALEQQLKILIADTHKRQELGQNAKAVVQNNKGALEKVLTLLKQKMEDAK